MISEKDALELIKGIVHKEVCYYTQEDREDIVGSCLIKFLTNKDKLLEISKDSKHYKNLVCATVKNGIVDYLRAEGTYDRAGKIKKKKGEGSDTLPIEDEDFAYSSLDQIALLEFESVGAKEHVRAILGQLSDRSNFLLTKIYIENWSTEELAVQMSMSQSWVSKYVRIALKEFKEKYEQSQAIFLSSR